MRVLVVGGSSSIGNTIVDAFVDEGVDVSATFNANRPAESRGAAWTRLDLSDPATRSQYGLLKETLSRFELSTGEVGYGMHENICLGVYRPHGFETGDAVAP